MGESAAALLKNGELVAAVEEERFTRVKHEGCFPVRSVEYCLAQEGISLADVAHIAVYWQPWRIGTRARGVISSAFRNPGQFAARFGRAWSEFSHAGAGNDVASHGSWRELFSVKAILQKKFGTTAAKVHYMDHHRTHMASAFFASPFEEATILTIDGAGEEFATTVSVGAGTTLTTLREIPWPHSLGHFYSTITGFLGLGMLDGEYKMMGLAPYNQPGLLKQFREQLLVSGGQGNYRLNTGLLDYHAALAGRFNPALVNLLGPPRNDADLFTQHHQVIAASAQAAFETVVSDLANWGFETGGRRCNLVIAGGCGLNCTANGKLLRDGPFDAIYVPPAPHDAGCAVGAALLVHHEVLGQPRAYRMTHAYYGPGYSDDQIVAAMKDAGVAVPQALPEQQLIEETAAALADGSVVAWFQGRMEFGPRALGSRSFLADPRSDGIRDAINEKIKKRELFRPFAPSVKKEKASEYFDAPPDSPFMNITVPVRGDKRSQIPAVTHVDGTARIQTVERETNPRYWSLLDAFERRTGVPVLLNTSFNIQEPIVCTPAEALRTFKGSRVDALAIGNFLLRREPAGA